jgi:hypothetical protein
VAEFLRRAGRAPSVRLVTYGEDGGAAARVEAICAELVALLEHPAYDPRAVDPAVLGELSAPALAGRLAGLLDRVRRRP